MQKDRPVATSPILPPGASSKCPEIIEEQVPTDILHTTNQILRRDPSLTFESTTTILPMEGILPVRKRRRPEETSDKEEGDEPTRKRRRQPPPDDGRARECTHCHVTQSPQWRWDGPYQLCNSCGVVYQYIWCPPFFNDPEKRHKFTRPKDYWNLVDMPCGKCAHKIGDHLAYYLPPLPPTSPSDPMIPARYRPGNVTTHISEEEQARLRRIHREGGLIPEPRNGNTARQTLIR